MKQAAVLIIGVCVSMSLANLRAAKVARGAEDQTPGQNNTLGARWLRRACGLPVLAAGGWLVLNTF